MYCHNFVCTYKLHDNDIQEDIYRAQMLQAFSLKEWDNNIIEEKTKILFDKLKNTEQLREIINKIKTSEKFSKFIAFIGDNDYDLFKILFVYDLFDIAHKCFCDVYKAGVINEENKKMLLNNI